MRQKKQRTNKSCKTLREPGLILSKKIFLRHTDYTKSSRLIRKIIIKNCHRTVLKKLERKPLKLSDWPKNP